MFPLKRLLWLLHVEWIKTSLYGPHGGPDIGNILQGMYKMKPYFNLRKKQKLQVEKWQEKKKCQPSIEEVLS